MQNENNEILLIASLQDLGHLYIATCLGSLFHSCIDLGKKENIKKIMPRWAVCEKTFFKWLFNKFSNKFAQYFGLKDKPSSGTKRKMKIKLKIHYK